MSPLFTGLSAFPLTPASPEGVVDVDALSRLVDRLALAGVDSIGVLGSTGTYAYLDRDQRGRAVAAAREAASGRVPVIAGVGALRSSWALDLARDAEALGADGLLLAPMSYTPLTQAEVADHCRAVAAVTGLPIAAYNNPGTTHFTFSPGLIAQVAQLPQLAAIKMPLPPGGDFAAELAALRPTVPEDFSIGYSGDWGAADALLAGADAFYSVAAGLLPVPMLALTRAAMAADEARTRRIDAAFRPLWALFKAYGSLRVMYALADHLGLPCGEPPLPLQRVGAEAGTKLAEALEALADV